MYKRYLEPNDYNSSLTKYMSNKLKQGKKISNQETGSSNSDICENISLIRDQNDEVIVEGGIGNDEVIQSRVESLQFQESNISNSIDDDDDYFHSITDQLIHPNLQCKTADGIAMILAYFLRHNLTWIALEDLLSLFHEVLGDESRLVKTKYFFRKCFSRKERAIFHFYCKKCMVYIDTYEKIKLLKDEDPKRTFSCLVCECEYTLNRMNEGNFFIELPLREQIEKKISEDVNMLDYNTISNSSDITDIFDCELYKSLRKEVGHGPLITLTLNTDGVRVFKSKKKSSLWPIQMFINEVPPNKRFKQDNIILSGIWFGKDPDFNLYLKPLIGEMKDLDENKINVNVDNINKVVTVRVLLITADSVAKPKILKMKQFNGEFGCNYCLHPGFMVGDSKTSKYIFSSTDYSLRTHSSTVALMRSYLSTNKEILGVTGVSPLIGFKDFDLIRGTVVDYMHAILLGVVHLLLNLWFDSENHREKYYITPRGKEVVNKNIEAITPLRTFTRKPRTIDEKEFWKAHEFKYWLLFYGIPCLKGTLKPTYLNHFTLLSEAIYIFLKAKITPADYAKASNNLNKFSKDFQHLYGEENMKFNVHLGTHLSKCVKDCGPLWGYSNFNFESNNGSLVQHVKGTTDVEHQIASKYSFNNVLASLIKKNETIFNYVERMKTMRVKNYKKVGQITLFGSAHEHKLDSNEKPILLHEHEHDSDYIMAYNKFFYSSDVYYSITYKRAEKTNDTIVLLKDLSIGQISLIFEEKGIVFLLLKMLEVETVLQFPAHIKKLCENIDNEYAVVPADEVLEKMLLISTVNEKYLSQLPNQFEAD